MGICFFPKCQEKWHLRIKLSTAVHFAICTIFNRALRAVLLLCNNIMEKVILPKLIYPKPNVDFEAEQEIIPVLPTTWTDFHTDVIPAINLLFNMEL